GLKNAPKSFQRIMEEILSDLECVTIFVDDVLISSETEADHYYDVKKVLTRLMDAGAKINYEKSSFKKREIKFLGCIVNENGIRADISKVSALKSRPPPKNKRELQKLLGFCNWFRKFVPRISDITATLSEKLKKCPKKINWTENDEKIRQKIFEKIEENLTLAHPDYKKPFELHTDASNIGIGGILVQENKLIGIYSKKLNKSESNYTTVEKELYAIIKSLENFREIIWGQEITIYTDSKNITHISNSLDSRTKRWKTLLAEYDYKMLHVAGEKNEGPDQLSRNYRAILKRENENTDIEKFIMEKHYELIHAGIERLFQTIRYSKENITREFIKKIIKKCIECQKFKNDSRKFGKIEGSIHSIYPMTDLCCDIYGPLPYEVTQTDKKLYILTMIDRCTRICRLAVMNSIESSKVAKYIEENWIVEFGEPHSILTDRGTQFTSDIFEKFCIERNIKHLKTSPYNPTCNGIAER
ncbi:putative LTR retrotransposable element, partial [Pseudoloma neurophilia]